MVRSKPTVASGAGLASHRAKSAPTSQPLFTIGDLAQEFGVTLRTLRFYEDRSLLHPVRDGHSRFYTEGDKARLALILKVKALGFTLGEIRDLILKGDGGNTGSLPLDKAQIASQIDHLRRQRDGIDQAISQLCAVQDHLAEASGT